MSGFRLRDMNVNEAAPKTNNPRLNKIKAVSLLVQTLLWVWLALRIYFLLCFVVLPPTKISDLSGGGEVFRLSIWSTKIPLAMLALLAVKMVKRTTSPPPEKSEIFVGGNTTKHNKK